MKGRITTRRLRQPGQNGAFGQVQLIDRFAEIVFRSGLHAICPVAQINLVKIKIKDILFAEDFIDAVGQDGFLDFALVTALRCQQKAFGHLLGDRTAALDDLATLQGFDSFKKQSNINVTYFVF